MASGESGQPGKNENADFIVVGSPLSTGVSALALTPVPCNVVAVSNGRRHEPAKTPASPSTRDISIAAFALCRPALRIVNDRVKSERAGPANLHAAHPGALQQHRLPPAIGPGTGERTPST